MDKDLTDAPVNGRAPSYSLARTSVRFLRRLKDLGHNLMTLAVDQTYIKSNPLDCEKLVLQMVLALDAVRLQPSVRAESMRARLTLCIANREVSEEQGGG